MPKDLTVSIVIPNWNGKDKLENNLPAVLKVANVSEIIISDDASTDGSIEFLEKNYPQIKLVKSNMSKNQGFSSNVNIGVSKASGDLIFLLNTDASPASDCLKFILPHFQDSKIFSVGCNVGGNWSWAKFENGYFWHYMSDQKSDLAHQTLWSSGGSGVFRRELWNKLGGLDENFDPFYEEDLDLGYRASKRGYINLWEPKAIVEHYKTKGVIEENYSKKVVSKVAQRNQLLFTWKNIHQEEWISSHRTALLKMLLTHPKYWEIFLKALVHLPDILSKRGVEKKASVISDQELLSKFAS